MIVYIDFLEKKSDLGSQLEMQVQISVLKTILYHSKLATTSIKFDFYNAPMITKFFNSKQPLNYQKVLKVYLAFIEKISSDKKCQKRA